MVSVSWVSTLKGSFARSRKPKLKTMHQVPEIMKGQAMVGTRAASPASVLTTLTSGASVVLDDVSHPQISSVTT